MRSKVRIYVILMALGALFSLSLGRVILFAEFQYVMRSNFKVSLYVIFFISISYLMYDVVRFAVEEDPKALAPLIPSHDRLLLQGFLTALIVAFLGISLVYSYSLRRVEYVQKPYVYFLENDNIYHYDYVNWFIMRKQNYED